jgi:hypothetical protein
MRKKLMNTCTLSILKKSTRTFLLMNGMRQRPKSKKLKTEGKNCWMLKGKRELRKSESEWRKKDKLD